MWGFGGKYYWGRKEREKEVVGIVVIFAWMFSQEKHVKSYVDLYYSLGWDSLICHSQFLNSFSSYRATSLSLDVLNELDEELKVRPCPVVFLSFSGGPKACMYKVIQIIDSRCPGGETLDYRLVRDCIAGFIYDSCPVDFTPDLGTPFVLSVLPTSCPPRLVKWVSDGFFAGMDALFCSSFESMRAEYWQTLYSSVSMRVPYLILCSEVDNLASCQIICNFAQRLEELGGDVRLLKWNSSPHVGHYRQHPDEYKGAVAKLLKSAFSVYSQKIQQHERANAVPDRAYDTFLSPQMEAAACSNDGLRKLSVESDGLFLSSGSLGCHDSSASNSLDSSPKEGLLHLLDAPKVTAHGDLNKILFDIYVPKDIEGSAIISPRRLEATSLPPAKRRVILNPIRSIPRARL
ncbi:hypothetical protein AKJ16_DCAP07548 [Drosera capensis]